MPEQTVTTATPLPGEGLTFYVLSRETAKLGHAIKPGVVTLAGKQYCPGCGSRVRGTPDSLAAGRETCSHVPYRPQNQSARLAAYFAAHLVTIFPSEDVVESLAQGRILQRLRAKAARQKDLKLPEIQNVNWHNQVLNVRYGETPFERLVRELTALILSAYKRDAKLSTSPRTQTLAKALYLLFLSVEGELRESLLIRTVETLYQATLKDISPYGLGKEMRQHALELLLLAGDTETANWRETTARLQAFNLEANGDLWRYFDTTLARLVRERAEARGVSAGTVKAAFVEERRKHARSTPTHYASKDWYGYSISPASGKVERGEARLGSATYALASLNELAGLAQYSRGRNWWKHSERKQAAQLLEGRGNPYECGEYLYQAVPNPRRYPLSCYIMKHARNLFDLLVLDEAHEFAGEGSAQQKAAHRLVELPGVPTVALTGSLMGGYASHLFTNFWALSKRFRREFGREDKQRFVSRYGYRKVLVTKSEDGKEELKAVVTGFGSVTDREERQETYVTRQLGEAPGVLPLFILKHLLPQAVLVSKEEVTELPPLIESRVPITPAAGDKEGQALLDSYQKLQKDLVAAIRYDLFNCPELAGKLWGAMSELVSYPDLASADTGNRMDTNGKRVYQVRYPENVGGGLVADGKLFPAGYIAPKERWLLDTLRAEFAEKRNVLVFVRHTGQGSTLVKRLTRLIREELGETAIFLDSAKPTTKEREAWIDREVIGKGRKVLLLNPNTVKTGLNNLVYFSTGVWFELDYSAFTYRQANGRLHRIGQTKPVRIYYPYYDKTAQAVAVGLLAKKVGASLQVDGLDIESALEAAGATEGGSFLSGQVAMSMGRAIYAMLL